MASIGVHLRSAHSALNNRLMRLPKGHWLTRALNRTVGFCPHHGLFLKTYRFRTNTAYVDEESNYVTGCVHCEEEMAEYYNDLWDTLYSDCL